MHRSDYTRISTDGEERMTPDAGKFARRYAFTLIELLVVIAIIAILAALLLPSLTMARGNDIHLFDYGGNLFMGSKVLTPKNHPDQTLDTPRGGPPVSHEKIFFCPKLAIRTDAGGEYSTY